MTNEPLSLQARDVQVGDRLSWCGRWVPVLEVELARGRGRGTYKPLRIFTVDVQDVGVQRRISYFYDEDVIVNRAEDDRG